MARRLLSLSLLLSLTGCATLPYASMTPEQIEALSKIKDASVACVSGMYAGANVTTVLINVDKGMPTGVTVEANCKMTFSNAKP